MGSRGAGVDSILKEDFYYAGIGVLINWYDAEIQTSDFQNPKIYKKEAA